MELHTAESDDQELLIISINSGHRFTGGPVVANDGGELEQNVAVELGTA